MSTFVETTCSILSFEEPDLVRSVSKPNTDMQLEQLLENADAVHRLVDGRRYYLIIVGHETATYSKEAREYVDERIEPLKKGEALVVQSLALRMIAMFYARTRRKHHPIRIFPTEWEALEWIDSLRAKETPR